MKKHVSLLLMTLVSVSLVLDGCDKGSSGTPGIEPQVKIQTEVQTEAETGDQTVVQSGDRTAPNQVSESPSNKSSSPAPESGVGGELNMGPGEDKLTCQATIRVGSLRSLTSMGLVSPVDKTFKGETSDVYELTMAGKADELVGKIASDDLDIALVPVGVVSVLHAKTQENITILDTNTLDILYVVTLDDSIVSMTDLKGCTTYMTRKGTAPEYVINHLLRGNGLSASDVDLQFRPEATEVVSLPRRGSSAIDVLPQPFAAAACIQNPGLKTVLDLTEQWNILSKGSGSMLVTGVILVRGGFFRENHSLTTDFIKDHKVSALSARGRTEDAA